MVPKSASLALMSETCSPSGTGSEDVTLCGLPLVNYSSNNKTTSISIKQI